MESFKCPCWGERSWKNKHLFPRLFWRCKIQLAWGWFRSFNWLLSEIRANVILLYNSVLNALDPKLQHKNEHVHSIKEWEDYCFANFGCYNLKHRILVSLYNKQVMNNRSPYFIDPGFADWNDFLANPDRG